jgi:hypothetical protein
MLVDHYREMSATSILRDGLGLLSALPCAVLNCYITGGLPAVVDVDGAMVDATSGTLTALDQTIHAGCIASQALVGVAHAPTQHGLGVFQHKRGIRRIVCQIVKLSRIGL